ncbi:hypothetical protein ACIPRD_14160 [Streptomyces sp. NPDC090108]|uniref:hypothetical protein n=1 Tax=Streptomyces sp. NPDC090108 TaxID=3365947 RepID=UPI0037F1C3B9
MTAALLLGLVLPGTQALAAPTRAAAATPPGLSCSTGKHNNDDYTGFALCENRGSQTQTFWVHLVCGWSPDVDGDHVTVPPGGVNQSTAHCSILGSGIGEISVRP